MTNSIWFVLLALSPLLVVLYLMLGRNWGGSRAGPMGWLAAVAVSLLFFGADVPLLLVATGKALLLSLYVLYIIWMALLLYHVVNDAGAIKAIGQELPRLAEGRAAQALLLAWVFGSFLQGASGFGVPAAVVAPLLVGLGFTPTVAVVAALLGHAWAVTYGSLGSSFFSLIAAAGVPGEALASPVAVYLGLCCFCCGFAVLWTTGQWAAVRRRGLMLVILTAVMAGTQWLLARIGLWNLAAFGAGLVGLIVMGGYLMQARRGSTAQGSIDLKLLGTAFWPYAIMTAVIVLGQIVLADVLDVWVINPTFPAVGTSLGWETAAGTGRSIDVFGHPGALLLYASGLAFVWYRRRGLLPTATEAQKEHYNGGEIVAKTVDGSKKSTISIFTLVAMATVMQHAGMTQIIAETLSNTGAFFPFLSPFIGALGAFMTGSNTNSNVVFGDLQRQTAVALSLSVPYILAAQTAGGAMGSVFAPAKVIVGCSTVEGADDSGVLKLATLYGLAVVVLVGIATWVVR